MRKCTVYYILITEVEGSEPLPVLSDPIDVSDCDVFGPKFDLVLDRVFISTKPFPTAKIRHVVRGVLGKTLEEVFRVSALEQLVVKVVVGVPCIKQLFKHQVKAFDCYIYVLTVVEACPESSSIWVKVEGPFRGEVSCFLDLGAQ